MFVAKDPFINTELDYQRERVARYFEGSTARRLRRERRKVARGPLKTPPVPSPRPLAE
ncbi:MAG: hypothetical protein ACRDPG_13920 [Nocardioidaceae bacterium]